MSEEVDARRLITLLPHIVEWATAQRALILKDGLPLSADGLNIARHVGVQEPEKVRVLYVDAVPLPEHEELRTLGLELEVIGPTIIGQVFGHGVYLKSGHEEDVQLASHELRHVAQYEQFGSIELFLSAYVVQVVENGYRNAPLEMDARAHEIESLI